MKAYLKLYENEKNTLKKNINIRREICDKGKLRNINLAREVMT